MEKFVFYTRNIDEFEKEFNRFVERNRSKDIRSVHFSLPFINNPVQGAKKTMVAIVYK